MKFKYNRNILKEYSLNYLLFKNVNDNSNEADERNDSDEDNMNL